jgi:hypothetical protein
VLARSSEPGANDSLTVREVCRPPTHPRMPLEVRVLRRSGEGSFDLSVSYAG